MGPAFSFVESITSQDHPAKRTSADMELRSYPKPKHLSSKLPNRNSYFLVTKHEKTIMACSYLNFSSHTENTSKQQKNGGFCEELLSENDFVAVLVNLG